MSILSRIGSFKNKTREKYTKMLDEIKQFLSNSQDDSERYKLCDEILKLKVNGSSLEREIEFIGNLTNLAKLYNDADVIKKTIRAKEYEKLSNYHLEFLCKSYRIEFNDRWNAITELERIDLTKKQNALKYKFAKKLAELQDQSFLDALIAWEKSMGLEMKSWPNEENLFEGKLMYDRNKCDWRRVTELEVSNAKLAYERRLYLETL